MIIQSLKSDYYYYFRTKKNSEKQRTIPLPPKPPSQSQQCLSHLSTSQTSERGSSLWSLQEGMSQGGSTQGGTERGTFAFSRPKSPPGAEGTRGPLSPPGCWERRAGCSPQVAADGVQALLEGRHEALLAAFQRLLVPHAILQAVEDSRHAGAQRLDGGDRLGESLQVHPGAQHPVRHLSPGPASLRSPERAEAALARSSLGNVVRGLCCPQAPPSAFFIYLIYLFSSFRNVRGFFWKGRVCFSQTAPALCERRN